MELAHLLGKSRREVEEMLDKQDMIELNLSEKKTSHKFKYDDLKIYE